MGGATSFVVLETNPVLPQSEIDDWVQPLDGDLEGQGWAITVGEADEVQVEVQVLDSAPEVDGKAAAVFEVSCEGEMVFVNDDGERLEIGTGSERVHRVRLCLVLDEPTVPRLVAQAWPSAPASPAMLRDNDETPPLELLEAAEGLAAAGRIGDDIDRGTVYPVEELTGVSVAEVVVRGEARYLCGYFEKARSWTTDEDDYLWYASWDRRFDGPTTFMRHEDHPDRLSGRTGALWSTHHPDYSEPHAVVLWWNWLVPPRDSPRRAFVDFHRTERAKRGGQDRIDAVKLLPRDTVRRVLLEQLPGQAKTVRIRVEHSGVPQAWANDLAAWSQYQLALFALSPGPLK